MARSRMHRGGIFYCCLMTAGIGQSEKVKSLLYLRRGKMEMRLTSRWVGMVEIVGMMS